MVLTYHLDASQKMPLYEQLYRAIRGDILSGALPGGARLPAKRQLAENLHVSHITVETAYSLLLAEGYLRSVPRSGVFVQEAAGGLQPVFADRPKTRAQERSRRELWEFDFDTGAVDTDCFPFSIWAKLSRAVLTEYESRILLSSAPLGVPALREEISRFLYSFRHISADPDQIIVGSGSEYMVNLIIQLLGRERTYALEDPCYPKLEQIFNASGAESAYLPMDREGLSVEALRGSQASAVYLTPAHHFPLGVVTSAGRRSALLRWASEAEGRYIIEDDYDSEFRFSSRPIPALKEMDGADRVIYMNTFAKTLAPSLRIGYAVLPHALMDEYRKRFSAYSSTVPSFEQYTLAHFMKTGSFERHVNRLRSLHRARRDSLLDALEQSTLRGRYTVSGSEAGQHLLLTVPALTERELVDRAAAYSCRVHGLSEYYREQTACPPSTVLLGYGGMPEERLRAGAARLAEAWQKA